VFIGNRLGLELFRKRYVTLAAALTLLLTVAPVYGTPSLKVGSTASYNLAASLSATQSCSANPTTYYNEACLGIYPPPPAFVAIYDNATCTPAKFSCGFGQPSLSVSAGTNVVWQNNGQLTHSVISNDTVNLVADPFNSGPLSPGSTFTHVFAQQGTYQYYDGNYRFLKGTAYVSPAASATTLTPSISQVGLNGNVGWTVEGLSSSTANLLVSHNLGVSISVPQLPGVTITPVTESGTFVQSIDLATRVESAGTATDLIEHLLDAYAAAASGAYGYNSGFGNIISQMSATASSDPSYTLWWVNGPLSNGSPVQVMDGWASVTGSETLDLGGLGNAQAWIITSRFSQGVNLTVPNSPLVPQTGPNAQAALNLSFLWSYDKGSDLLVRSFANGTITMHSVSSTQVSTNGYCYSYPCTYTTVQVTRDLRLTVTLALHLTSTSLSLDQRMRSRASTLDMSSMLEAIIATPWMTLSIVGVAAGAIIVFSLWLTRRVRRGAMPEATPTPVSDPMTPPTTP